MILSKGAHKFVHHLHRLVILIFLQIDPVRQAIMRYDWKIEQPGWFANGMERAIETVQKKEMHQKPSSQLMTLRYTYMR